MPLHEVHLPKLMGSHQFMPILTGELDPSQSLGPFPPARVGYTYLVDMCYCQEVCAQFAKTIWSSYFNVFHLHVVSFNYAFECTLLHTTKPSLTSSSPIFDSFFPCGFTKAIFNYS